MRTGDSAVVQRRQSVRTVKAWTGRFPSSPMKGKRRTPVQTFAPGSMRKAPRLQTSARPDFRLEPAEFIKRGILQDDCSHGDRNYLIQRKLDIQQVLRR